jgi:hypothetical protein
VPRARTPLLALTLISVLVQIPGATVDFVSAGAQATATLTARCPGCDLFLTTSWRDFVPAGSDIATETQMLLAGRVDLAWVTFSGTWLVPATVLLAACAAAAGIITLRRPLHPAKPSSQVERSSAARPGRWRKSTPRTQGRSSWIRKF